MTFGIHFPCSWELAEIRAYVVYHMMGCGTCSWCEFAKAILDTWLVEGTKKIAMPSVASGRPARRPANLVLENGALKRAHFELMPYLKRGACGVP